MRYVYGTNSSYINSKGRSVTAKQLASIIKRDVDYGKWNTYDGGVEDNTSATCMYKSKGFVHHQLLLIYGNKKEFKRLEKLLDGVIKITPRKFN